MIQNGSFEVPYGNNCGAANWTSDPNGTYQTVSAVSSYGSFVPTDGSMLLYMEGTTPASGPVTPPNCYVQSDLFSVAGGASYDLSFDAANPVKVGGANPQYRISWFKSDNTYISDSGFISFASAGNAWTTITTSKTAPANAAKAQMHFIQAEGAGNGWDWVTLIEDVSVVDSTAAPVPSTNVLSATVQPAAGISWKSGVGLTYTVQSSPSINPAVWTPFGANVIGTGTNTASDVLASPFKFYRVLEDY